MKIGIIGGGPRGLITLSHAVNNFKRSPASQLTIHVFDPFAPGGQVWRIDQSQSLIMNTIVEDLSLSATTDPNGVNLFQWAQQFAEPFIDQQGFAQAERFKNLARQLKPNSYTPRVLLGLYARWFYQRLIDRLPQGVTVKYHQTPVTAINKVATQWRITTTNDQWVADQVVLTINTSAHQQSATERALADYASQEQLYYQGPAYPGDIQKYPLTADQNVIIRGLGMSFFDELIKLTVDRGGQFERTATGKLIYHPSGQEPRIFAGSRRGVTYYPKAVVQPASADYHFQAHFVTEAQIDRRRVNGKITVAQFRQLVRHEIELVYYQLVLKQQHPAVDQNEFIQQFVADPEKAVQNAPFRLNEILRWDMLLNPIAGTPITTTADYQNTLINWLAAVSDDAEAGLGFGPLISALTVYKEIRPMIRKVLETKAFTEADYLQNFLTTFKANSQLLSNGAPAVRFQQLIALMNAGIVTILGPQMNVAGANHHFIAISKFYPKEPMTADALIEARIPRLNFATTESELINELVQTGLIHPAEFKDADGNAIPINAIQIDPKSDQLVTSNGKLQTGFFVFSTLTEGIHWLTTIFPMIGDDDNHRSAEQISRQILGIPVNADDLL